MFGPQIRTCPDMQIIQPEACMIGGMMILRPTDGSHRQRELDMLTTHIYKVLLAYKLGQINITDAMERIAVLVRRDAV